MSSAGKMALTESKFEVVCLKEVVLDLFSIEARQKGVELAFEIDEWSCPDSVDGFRLVLS
jgi:hypothetical protein